MKDTTIKGCGTALVTPLRDGAVDYDAYARMVRRQTAAGIHFLVPLGSTAETPCLDDDEKRRLLDTTMQLAEGRTVIAGVGTNSLRHTVRNMQLLSAADMYLVVVPYYNKPTPRGQYEYFRAVAESTDKPIVLYNVPSRTGVNMSADVTLRLAELPNVVAIKEASGNLEQVRRIIAGRPEGFSVLSGNDDQTLDMMMLGGDGVVSVASNMAPALMTELVEAAAADDYNRASTLFRRLIPLFDACFVESNPIPVKAGLAALGLCTPEMRLPLTPAEESTSRLMASIAAKLGLE